MHPSVKIVKFDPYTALDNANSHARHGKTQPDVGTLPYSSTFEQNIAVGALRIYRTMQGFAMLSCGSGKCVRPIMPKSKSWCVDDDSSKFVFPIGRTIFWRIELPTNLPNHETKAEELKVVLSQISQFEKTPCPFSRNFYVELPEPPKTPVIKRPWRPVKRPSTAPNGSVVSKPPGSEAVSKPEQYGRFQRRASSGFLATSSPGDSDTSGLDTVEEVETPTLTASNRNSGYFPSMLRPEALEKGRSIRAPQLNVVPAQSIENSPEESPDSPPNERSKENLTPTLSSRRTESWEAPSTHPLRPTASVMRHYPKDDISMKKRGESIQNVTQDSLNERVPTVETPKTPRVWQMLDGNDDVFGAESSTTLSSSPTHPGTPNQRRNSEVEYFDASESASPSPWPRSASPTVSLVQARPESPASLVRAARRASSSTHEMKRYGRTLSMSKSERTLTHRALSPPPSAANLFIPSCDRERRLQTARHLPTAIIQKTWEILMSPPSHLVELIMQVAAQVARRLRNGQSWDEGLDTEDEGLGSDDDMEDDYGMPIKPSRITASLSSSSSMEEVSKIRSRERWHMPGAYGSDLD